MPKSISDAAPSLLSRRQALIGLALAASSGIAFARQPRSQAAVIPTKKFETWVPQRVDAWTVAGTSGVVLPPPDALRDRLYDNLVTRVYESPVSPPVMLLLAYNNLQDGVVQVHRPEVCYPVGGYELSETQEVSLPVTGKVIPANFFTAKGPDRTEQVLYFTRLGHGYPRNWGEQRWTVIQANIGGRIPDGMMMRVSLLGGNQASSFEILRRFTVDFIAASALPLRKLLLV
jgi:EpsI family protein